MMTVLLYAGVAAGGIYVISKIFGEKVASDAVRIPLEAGGEALVNTAVYALKEIGNIYLKGADVIGIVVMMGKEALGQWLYSREMRKIIIPERCSFVLKIAAKIKDAGLILMDDLAFLVAFMREYKEVAVPTGNAMAYDQHAVTVAMQLLSVVQHGVVPTVYNADLVFKVMHDKAMKDYTVKTADFVYLQGKVNSAISRRMTSGWGIPDSKGMTRPWGLILGNEVIEKAKEFIGAVNDGTIKQI